MSNLTIYQLPASADIDCISETIVVRDPDTNYFKKADLSNHVYTDYLQACQKVASILENNPDGVIVIAFKK